MEALACWHGINAIYSSHETRSRVILESKNIILKYFPGSYNYFSSRQSEKKMVEKSHKNAALAGPSTQSPLKLQKLEKINFSFLAEFGKILKWL